MSPMWMKHRWKSTEASLQIRVKSWKVVSFDDGLSEKKENYWESNVRRFQWHWKSNENRNSHDRRQQQQICISKCLRIARQMTNEWVTRTSDRAIDTCETMNHRARGQSIESKWSTHIAHVRIAEIVVDLYTRVNPSKRKQWHRRFYGNFSLIC